MRRWFCSALLALAGAACALADADGGLSKELAGTSLTYQYEGGRRYSVRFEADTVAWQRLDVARDPVAGVPYIARRIAPDVYLVNWHRPELTEYITILFDLRQRVMHTSALLEGRDRHFESGRIVELQRPKR